jgi:hypothetical protein
MYAPQGYHRIVHEFAIPHCLQNMVALKMQVIFFEEQLGCSESKLMMGQHITGSFVRQPCNTSWIIRIANKRQPVGSMSGQNSRKSARIHHR